MVKERYEYDPFGNLTILNAEGEEIAKSSYGNPITYTGQRFDADTGLYYYKNRYYSPNLGRFLTKDPLDMIDSPNLYAYVTNDPINYIDPMGTQTLPSTGDSTLPSYSGASQDEAVIAVNDSVGGGQSASDCEMFNKIMNDPNVSLLDTATESFKRYEEDIQNKLGVYRDYKGPAIYNNNPIIYEQIDMRVGGIGEFFSDISIDSLAYNLANGSILKGSQKIVVWGEEGKSGTSWVIYKYDKVATDVTGKLSKYDWKPVEYKEVIGTDIIDETLQHFDLK